MVYVVYILQSEQDGSFYIGHTGDLGKRLADHNSGESRYTKRKVPWRLVYEEKFETRSEAMKREKFLKAQKNKEFYLRLIAENK